MITYGLHRHNLQLAELVKRSLKQGFAPKNSVAIAGGFLRDSIMNKEYSDIDIFAKVGVLDIEKLAKEVGTEAILHSSSTNGYGALSKVYNVGKIQVIELVQDVEVLDHIKGFHLDLSKIAYFPLGGGHYYIDQSFVDDVFNKTLTFSLTVQDSYMEKMAKRYPDFEVNFFKE